MNIFLLWKARRSAGGRRALLFYFDPAYYLARYPDIASTKVNPLWHYVLQGFQEGRSPSSRFNARDYLRQYPDVGAAGLNPLLHYACYGKGENRATSRSPYFALGASNAAPEQQAVVYNAQWPDGAPLISVILASSQSNAHAAEAIRSVFSQTFKNLELIVVRDAANTGFEGKCRELEAAGRSIRFLDQGKQPGASRNRAVGAARGRYVCFVEAGDSLKPIYLEAAVFLAEGYGYHLVYPSAAHHAGNGCVAADARFPEILEANPILSMGLFRKEAWAGIGGYRQLGSGNAGALESWDFWVRFLAQGYRAKSIKARALLYKAQDGSLTENREPDAEHQRQIQSANAALLEDAAPQSTILGVKVMDPWINLESKPDTTPGFLLALPFITLGGAETLLRGISRAVVDRGWRLIVITTLGLPPTVGDHAASFEEITPHIYPLPSLFGDREERWEDFLRYLLVRYNVGTIMIAGCHFLYRVLPAVRTGFPGVRVVDQLFNEEVHLPDNRNYARYIDVTIVPSQGFADTLIDKHGELPERVAVIPHGVCTTGPRLENRAAALGACGLPAAGQGKFLVSFFGRLSPEKAPDVFVEIAQLLKDHDEIYFCMTGDGPLRSAVLGLIDRYKLQGRIYAPGFVEDARTLMELSDVVVVPSRVDGMPLVVLEAQALGKPVVASAVGSIPHMIADKETGFLCAPGDVEGFSRCILELSAAPQRRREIGAAAQMSVRRGHDLETMMNAYMRVFRGIQQVGA